MLLSVTLHGLCMRSLTKSMAVGKPEEYRGSSVFI